MSLKETIQEDLKTALKNGEKDVAMVLRSLISELNKKEIEKNKKEEGLEEEEIQKVVLGEIKARQDSVREYKKAGRDELVKKEEKEIEVLQQYAPDLMSEDEIITLIDDTIKETGAAGIEDMGKVMKSIMSKVGNKAEGSLVNKLVKEKLENI